MQGDPLLADLATIEALIGSAPNPPTRVLAWFMPSGGVLSFVALDENIVGYHSAAGSSWAVTNDGAAYSTLAGGNSRFLTNVLCFCTNNATGIANGSINVPLTKDQNYFISAATGSTQLGHLVLALRQ